MENPSIAGLLVLLLIFCKYLFLFWFFILSSYLLTRVQLSSTSVLTISNNMRRAILYDWFQMTSLLSHPCLNVADCSVLRLHLTRLQYSLTGWPVSLRYMENVSPFEAGSRTWFSGSRRNGPPRHTYKRRLMPNQTLQIHAKGESAPKRASPPPINAG